MNRTKKNLIEENESLKVENKLLKEKIKRLESDLLKQDEDLDDTLIQDELMESADDSYDYSDGFVVRG